MKFASKTRSAYSASGLQTPRQGGGAFSLVEVLVAIAILLIILVVIFNITQMISQTWGRSTAKIEAFQGARAAFTSTSRQVSQATLNTYYDYFDVTGTSRADALKAGITFSPARYGRYSDLHFITGKSLVTKQAGMTVDQVGHSLFFQAPMGQTDDKANYGGMNTLLNACGYFVAYDKDNSLPAFLSTLPHKPADRYRFRLMQFLQPTQNIMVYDPNVASPTSWFQAPLMSTSPPVGILTENVVALIVLPKLSRMEEGVAAVLAPDFEYDTRKVTSTTSQGLTDHQLPPVVEIIMVAIDEASAQRFCTSSGMPDFGIDKGLNNLFQTEVKLEDDLKVLTDAFVANHIAYRVFRSEIALRGAKWSSQ